VGGLAPGLPQARGNINGRFYRPLGEACGKRRTAPLIRYCFSFLITFAYPLRAGLPESLRRATHLFHVKNATTLCPSRLPAAAPVRIRPETAVLPPRPRGKSQKTGSSLSTFCTSNTPSESPDPAFPGRQAAVQVNQSTAGFPTLHSSRIREQPLTPPIEARAILDLPQVLMYTGGRSPLVDYPDHCINTTLLVVLIASCNIGSAGFPSTKHCSLTSLR